MRELIMTSFVAFFFATDLVMEAEELSDYIYAFAGYPYEPLDAVLKAAYANDTNDEEKFVILATMGATIGHALRDRFGDDIFEEEYEKAREEAIACLKK